MRTILRVILDDKQEKRLNNLAKRYKEINKWNAQQTSEFITRTLHNNMDAVLAMLEEEADKLEAAGKK